MAPQSASEKELLFVRLWVRKIKNIYIMRQVAFSSDSPKITLYINIKSTKKIEICTKEGKAVVFLALFTSLIVILILKWLISVKFLILGFDLFHAIHYFHDFF
jgi:hypothetical protein